MKKKLKKDFRFLKKTWVRFLISIITGFSTLLFLDSAGRDYFNLSDDQRDTNSVITGIISFIVFISLLPGYMEMRNEKRFLFWHS